MHCIAWSGGERQRRYGTLEEQPEAPENMALAAIDQARSPSGIPVVPVGASPSRVPVIAGCSC